MRSNIQEKLKLGIVGFGRLGAVHAKNIANSEIAELYAVCDSSQEARERAEISYGAKTFACLEDFLSLPLEGVIVATTTSEHLAAITATANAGIPVFTEKPVGLTLEETDIALQQVVNAGVQFQIGFQRRWDPRYIEAKKVIESGEIGEAVLIKSYGRDPNASNPANWGLDKNGGLFLNAAIHDYDAARFFFQDEATAITASGAALVYKDLTKLQDIDTCATTLFFHDDKMAITEWSRYAAYGYDIGTEIICTEGAIRIGSIEQSRMIVKYKNSYAPTLFDVFADAFQGQIEGFIQSVKEGKTASPGIEDARIALQLALLARESFTAKSERLVVSALSPLKKQPLTD